MDVMTTEPRTPSAPSATSATSDPSADADLGTGERADLLEALRTHRGLFRYTVASLTDEQARLTPTVSTLTLGGLIKHVAATEAEWARFIVEGPAEGSGVNWANVDWANPPPEVQQQEDSFRMQEHETLAGLLAHYEEVATATDELVLTVDLDARQALPAAPWFKSGASWSARRVVLHVVAETAQHAGHADILRESIDGQKSMG